MIYFVGLPGGSIKIGFTDNLDLRLDALESHYGVEPVPLGTRQGGRAAERRPHERFAHLRLDKTEQFRPGADPLAFIGKPLLVTSNPEAIEVYPAIPPKRVGSPVRLDPRDEDLERLDRVCRARGLSRAAFSRMAVIERIKEYEDKDT